MSTDDMDFSVDPSIHPTAEDAVLVAKAQGLVLDRLQTQLNELADAMERLQLMAQDLGHAMEFTAELMEDSGGRHVPAEQVASTLRVYHRQVIEIAARLIQSTPALDEGQ